jgi:very-short-patch-repair endonuclease
LKEEAVAPHFQRAFQAAGQPSVMSLQYLPIGDVAEFIFHVPGGSVVILGGVIGATLREVIDQSEPPSSDRRVLFVRLPPLANVEAYVEQVIAVLAETAMHLWPCWFTSVSFAMCRDDALGRQAAGVIARETAARFPTINSHWAEAAARLALTERSPRVPGVLPAIELAQLSLAVSRLGLILVADVSGAADAPNTAALAHSLEWIAQRSGAAIVAVFPAIPSFESSFERILYGARQVIPDATPRISIAEMDNPASAGSEIWLAPWRGTPHPLSEIEQRLAALLGDDSELAELFHFNWFVDTVRGSRPKVDLVWMGGRLVVELDGYPDHTTRRAFITDRHRDYELALSGFTVLRLANDEVAQDFGRAIEKIRDLVRLRRSQMKQEG